MRRAVEEIGIAKRDVLGARGHVRANVLHHDVDRHRLEAALIDRHDRAVPAQMLAAARRVGAADDAPRAVGHLQRGIPRQRQQRRAVRLDELNQIERLIGCWASGRWALIKRSPTPVPHPVPTRARRAPRARRD